jgi:uncharacterized protein (TIGR02453 family)
MAITTTSFRGFEPAAIQFMADLAENNDRAWFQPRKADYERLLKEPFEALVREMAIRFQARGLPLLADPKRSLFRIYRDTRFSRDKAPYKRHLGASFPWTDGSSPDDRAHGSGGYFNFGPGEMSVGGGMWMPEKARLDAFRRAVIDEPHRVRKAIEDPGFVAAFGTVTAHESLKRVPPGMPADHPMAELLRMKDVVFGRPLADEDVLSPALPDVLADAFEAGLPVLRLLAGLRA